MENKIKKITKNILIYLGFVLAISAYVLPQYLGNLDEMWVYNFSKCIADGLLPYKDISMVITPLLPIIGAVFLKIFGNSMFVFRILEILETAGILFLMYKIMQTLKIKKGIALTITLMILFGYSHLGIFCFDYNWTVLLIELLLLYIELKSKEIPLECKIPKEIMLGILARKHNIHKANLRTSICSYFHIL